MHALARKVGFVAALVLSTFALRSTSETLDRSVLQRVGGDFKITKIEHIDSGFKVKFFNPEHSKIQTVILLSDHIHAGIKEGETVRISADIQRVDGSTGYASQILLFVPSSQGKIPVWITARDSRLEINRDFLKMHAPTNDYMIF